MQVNVVVLTENGLGIHVGDQTVSDKDVVSWAFGSPGDAAEAVYLAGQAQAWATENLTRVTAEYVQWTGRTRANAADAKRPEWHAKAVLEASDQYLHHKNRIALAERIRGCTAALSSAITFVIGERP